MHNNHLFCEEVSERKRLGGGGMPGPRVGFVIGKILQAGNAKRSHAHLEKMEAQRNRRGGFYASTLLPRY